MELIKIREHKEISAKAAEWFHLKWDIPVEAYAESISECLKNEASVPQWYVAMEKDKIIGGYGMKNTLINEFNALGIKDLQINDLNLLDGAYVNLEYQLPNGQSVKLLEDDKVYWGNQVERPGSDRCYGLVADEKYLLVCEYGCEGAEPEIVVYKRR